MEVIVTTKVHDVLVEQRVCDEIAEWIIVGKVDHAASSLGAEQLACRCVHTCKSS